MRLAHDLVSLIHQVNCQIREEVLHQRKQAEEGDFSCGKYDENLMQQLNETGGYDSHKRPDYLENAKDLYYLGPQALCGRNSRH